MSSYLGQLSAQPEKLFKSPALVYLREEQYAYHINRVVCPNFEHPALTSSFTKYEFLQVKFFFATIVNELSVLKLFKLSNGDLLFS